MCQRLDLKDRGSAAVLCSARPSLFIIHRLFAHTQVEIWVMLADPLGYVLDSKPYLAPILTPYEALLAFTVRRVCVCV